MPAGALPVGSSPVSPYRRGLGTRLASRVLTRRLFLGSIGGSIGLIGVWLAARPGRGCLSGRWRQCVAVIWKVELRGGLAVASVRERTSTFHSERFGFTREVQCWGSCTTPSRFRFVLSIVVASSCCIMLLNWCSCIPLELLPVARCFARS